MLAKASVPVLLLLVLCLLLFYPVSVNSTTRIYSQAECPFSVMHLAIIGTRCICITIQSKWRTACSLANCTRSRQNSNRMGSTGLIYDSDGVSRPMTFKVQPLYNESTCVSARQAHGAPPTSLVCGAAAPPLEKRPLMSFDGSLKKRTVLAKRPRSHPARAMVAVLVRMCGSAPFKRGSARGGRAEPAASLVLCRLDNIIIAVTRASERAAVDRVG